MHEETFWQLIETSKKASRGDLEKQADELTKIITGLAEGNIIDFGAHFDKSMARSYTWDLWAAAYIINGGCSDDGFDYFRAWLIAQGQKVFEVALRDPESLVDVADPEADGEPFLYIAQAAYEAKTGADLPAGRGADTNPSGEPWDEETVNKKYPKLAAKFG